MKRRLQTTSVGSSSSKSQRYSADAIQENYTDQLIGSKRHEYFSPSLSTRELCGDGSFPESLLDLSAKVCALTLPYEAVEEKCISVPEPVTKKFLLWSFPRCEDDIRRYSSICYCGPEAGKEECKGCHFEKGVSMVEKEKVKDVLQIGFRLMGKVEMDGLETTTGSNRQVSMSFDRCKITSANCDCDMMKKGILFCSHIVALAIFRIRKPQLVTFRPPISDTLELLDRSQLQKLTQYLIAQHKKVLPTAHTIVELLVNLDSDLNSVEGAPDPSAGGALDDEDRWALGEDETKLHLANILQSYESSEKVVKKVQVLLNKVRDMLCLRDRNGPYLLTIITEELLNHFLTNASRNSCITGWSSVWEKIGNFWTCVVLNPVQDSSLNYVSSLNEWESRLAAAEFLEAKQRAELAQLVRTDPSIFSFAIKASSIKWDDEQVRNIFRLSSPICKAAEEFESDTTMFQIEAPRQDKPRLSNEPSTSSAPMTEQDIKNFLESMQAGPYMSALMTEDHIEEPIDLSKDGPSMSPVWMNEEPIDLSKKPRCPSAKNVDLNEGPDAKLHCEDSSLLWHEPLPIAVARVETLLCHGYKRRAKVLVLAIAHTIKHNHIALSSTELNLNSNTDSLSPSSESVIEDYRHPFELIEVLVDILMGMQETQENAEEAENKLCNYKNLAFEVILRSLANRTCITSDSADQLVLLKRAILAESALIDRLKKLQSNKYMEHVVEESIFRSLEEVAVLSGTGKIFLPFYRFASYLFENLCSKTLQFRIVKLALECPLSQNFATMTDSESDNSALHKRHFGNHPHPETSKTFIKNRMEADLCDLAMKPIKFAQVFVPLQEILQCLLQNVKNPEHLLLLSKEAFKTAKEYKDYCDMHMVHAAVDLCKQALVFTIDDGNSSSREEMIRFLVVCAAEAGFRTISSILKDEAWCCLFKPAEAVNLVAVCLSSSSTAEVLKLDQSDREEELQKYICWMALKSFKKDPDTCALPCLKVCEKQPPIFNEAYYAIEEVAKNDLMKPCKLYPISKYLKECGFIEWALTIGLAATCCLNIGIKDKRHSLIDDLLWTIELGLGTPGLMEDLLKAVCDNIKAPTVLANILKKCTKEEDSSDSKKTEKKSTHGFPADSPVLQPLAEAAISAFTEAIHEKLRSITSGRYKDFISFFKKAHETFLAAPNGRERFEELKSHLVTVHKRKKKLVFLIQQEFNEENASNE